MHHRLRRCGELARLRGLALSVVHVCSREGGLRGGSGPATLQFMGRTAAKLPQKVAGCIAPTSWLAAHTSRLYTRQSDAVQSCAA